MTGTLIIDFLLTDHIDRNRRLGWNVRCENLEPIGPNLKKLSPKNRASRGLKSIVVSILTTMVVNLIPPIYLRFHGHCWGILGQIDRSLTLQLHPTSQISIKKIVYRVIEVAEAGWATLLSRLELRFYSYSLWHIREITLQSYLLKPITILSIHFET